ncbi:MAG: hypothetical protein GWM87_01165, partial [Xanthomonadales bacterium]|nr:hypothetical protein [Xanthomonadales bacterium]NIX11699.1 hypothetical protein [Xanthomonadales bacterium]
MSALHARHLALGAQFDTRGGWLVPDSYPDAGEGRAVLREGAGLADISAKGKLVIRGEGAAEVAASVLGAVPERPGAVIT